MLTRLLRIAQDVFGYLMVFVILAVLFASCVMLDNLGICGVTFYCGH
jgi:hypothetical protein